MGFLNSKRLLEKEKVKVEKVDLNDGDFVFVREMTGYARDKFEQSLVKYIDDPSTKAGVRIEREIGDFRSKLVVNTVCDETGTLLLKPRDWDQLSRNMSAVTLEKIAEAAMKLNKISEEDKEELVKNSEGGLAADSNSD